MNYTELLPARPHSSTETGRIARPSPLLLVSEARAFLEFGAGLALWPLLQLAPSGDGHPVLVLPGFLAGNSSTLLLRHYLGTRGYQAQGWKMGVNLGHRRHLEAALLGQLEEISVESQRKVSIVGWSLGGAFARLLAARRPELVRSVITLGSPIGGGPAATNAEAVYQTLNGRRDSDFRLKRIIAHSLGMPTTSIYSRSDGVVSWRASTIQAGAQAENIEVHGSHVGLGVNPAVLYAVDDRCEGRHHGATCSEDSSKTSTRPAAPSSA